MKRTTERKWHSWLNGVALTTCPSMWRDKGGCDGLQEKLCWPPPTDHRHLDWRESAALNSWGCTSQRTSPGLPTPSLSQRGTTAPTLSPPAEKSKPPSTHPHHLLQGYHWERADQLHHCLVRKLLCSSRKTLQRTVNTAAKIGAPLPSILDIFLTRCSSKAKSIVEDPTHPSHSLFQLLPSGRRYRSIRARSARLLNSFFPQAVRALNSHHTARSLKPQTHPPPPPYHISGKKLLNFYLCGIQVSGPAQATCSNTCSTHTCTRHFTHHCVSIIPQKTDCNIL